jgi:Ca2+:H+ antiporter
VSAIMIGVYVLGLVYSLTTHRHLFHEEVGEEAADWSKRRALTVLGLATGGVAVMAELLVGSIAGLESALGLRPIFVGVVIVAIVGNAAEHGGAVVVARRGKIRLASEIAVSSAAQVALLVAPLAALLSYALGKPLPLSFRPVEIATIAGAALLVGAVVWDRRGMRREGVLLLVAYAACVAAYWVSGNR